jgi:hypothetical protein
VVVNSKVVGLATGQKAVSSIHNSHLLALTMLSIRHACSVVRAAFFVEVFFRKLLKNITQPHAGKSLFKLENNRKIEHARLSISDMMDSNW